MSSTLHVAKKHVVEYEGSGWFNYNQDQLHGVLDALNVSYTGQGEWADEYDTEFSISRNSLQEARENLIRIDKGEDIPDVDVDLLSDCLDNVSMTLSELVQCFDFLLNESDQNDTDYIYVSFF